MQLNQYIPRWVRQRIPKAIKDLAPPGWRGLPAPIYNLDTLQAYGSKEKRKIEKRALLSYITLPFRLSKNDPRNFQFSNIGIARSIVRALNELGYVVDVIEYTDTKFHPRREYDLFIGHGGYNFECIKKKLSPETLKIYLSTGIYWKEFNQREVERFKSLEQRRGVQLPLDRMITNSEESANCAADAIICLGNKNAKKSYEQFPLVVNINNAVYSDDHYEHAVKDFTFERSNFLFLAGSGNVHKGLDLLLEIFSQIDAHLWICQDIEPHFYEIYQRELQNFHNIHLIGSIPMRSSQFYYLIDRCAFIIHPSCAEGQPGAVIECMHQGLIPIVSHESNIDTDGYGITLKNCSLEELTEIIKDLSQRAPEWCEEMSYRTRNISAKEYSEATFLENMKNAIKFIIDKKKIHMPEVRLKVAISKDFGNGRRPYKRNGLEGIMGRLVSKDLRSKKKLTISERINRFVDSKKNIIIPEKHKDFENQVCIIVPCYKHEKYLRATFESIIHQTWRPFKVIFINDSSPDNTQTVLESLIHNNPEDISCEILKTCRNLGQSEALNFGIRHTNAEVIMILKDDDYLMYDALEFALNVLKTHDELFMIGATSFWFREDRDLRHWPKNISEIVGSKALRINKWGPHDALKFSHPNDINMTHSSCTFFKSAWEAVNGYFPNKGKRVVKCSDRDFQMRVCSLVPIGISQEVPFAFWREGSSIDKELT